MNKKIFLASKLQALLLKLNVVLIKTPSFLNRSRKIDLSYRGWDYLRTSSLELCASEIYDKSIEGSVAELGVYQGEFAKRLNEAFPDRNLFLYDTFEGFAQADIDREKEVGIQDSSYAMDFSNTSIDLVLSKMPNKKNCIIRKGYFPATANEEADERFVFVSIDTDLYKPIYDGLTFFYPKLVQGGFIFIHDYNNSYFSGAKKAVQEFCTENDLSFFPLSDIGGTAVISK